MYPIIKDLEKPKLERISEEDRFWAKVDIRGEDECWVWTGNKWGNYGRFKDDDGRWVGSHRWVLEEKLGRFLPSDIYALHSCDNPPCCNPKHISEGTHAENMQQMSARGRGRGKTTIAKRSANRHYA